MTKPIFQDLPQIDSLKTFNNMERSSLADISVGHRFNEYADKQQAAVKKVLSGTSEGFNPITGLPIAPVAPVAVKYEEYYDPSDNRADWSGFVPNPTGRAHTNNPSAHRVQMQTNGEYNGLVPSESAATSDWQKPQRKAFNTDNNGSNGRSSTFSLIGGPTPVNNPNQLDDTSQWETEAQAAARRNGTFVDQLTSGGKSMYVKGKREVKPAFENPNQYDPNARRENPYDAQQSAFERELNNRNPPADSNGDPDNLIGFRQHNGGQQKSFLSGLGKEVARNPDFKKPKNVTTAPFATDGNLPTDPYASAKGGRSKDLFVENYSRGMPGYTGRR